MHRSTRLLATLPAALALAASATPGAGAADLGGAVAACARDHLGQRDGAPAVTCHHDGMHMTFPTFGAMVQHMKLHHGW